MIFFGRVMIRVALLGFSSLLLSSCLQLETPHTFREDEEIKIRAKNLHSYYQELEESIRLEQYHIKLLQATLNIKRTEEQTMAAQIEEKQKEIDLKSKDKGILDTEIQELEKSRKLQMEKRKGTEAALAAEKKKTADTEKSIGEEAGRIGRARVRMNQTLADMKKIEGEIATLEASIAAKKETVEKLKEGGAALDADLEAEVRRLVLAYQEEMKAKEGGAEFKADELGKVKNSLTQAALGLEKLQKGIESLQKYYEAKKGAEGELESIQTSTKDLMDAIKRIQDLFEEEKKDSPEENAPSSSGTGDPSSGTGATPGQ